jgi:hypothetical protein
VRVGLAQGPALVAVAEAVPARTVALCSRTVLSVALTVAARYSHALEADVDDALLLHQTAQSAARSRKGSSDRAAAGACSLSLLTVHAPGERMALSICKHAAGGEAGAQA